MKDTLKVFALGIVFWLLLFAGALIGLERMYGPPESPCEAFGTCSNDE